MYNKGNPATLMPPFVAGIMIYFQSVPRLKNQLAGRIYKESNIAATKHQTLVFRSAFGQIDEAVNSHFTN